MGKRKKKGLSRREMAASALGGAALGAVVGRTVGGVRANRNINRRVTGAMQSNAKLYGTSSLGGMSPAEIANLSAKQVYQSEIGRAHV